MVCSKNVIDKLLDTRLTTFPICQRAFQFWNFEIWNFRIESKMFRFRICTPETDTLF
jgi:hypothetical protein